MVVTCTECIYFIFSASQQQEQGLSTLSLVKIAISPLTLLKMVASPMKVDVASTDQAMHTNDHM